MNGRWGCLGWGALPSVGERSTACFWPQPMFTLLALFYQTTAKEDPMTHSMITFAGHVGA